VQTVSPQFLPALGSSHTLAANVAAFYDGALTLADVPYTAGSVTVDRGSKVRRSLQLTVADPALLPETMLDPLAPAGQRLVAQRGVRYPSGAVELVQLGDFRIDDPAGDVDLGPVTLTGQSAEAAVAEDVFTAPTTTRGWADVPSAIAGLIHQTLPTAVVDNRTGRAPLCPTRTWDRGADRWDAVLELATSMQAELYVDALGTFVLRNPPNALTDPVVWEIAAGDLLIDDTRQMSRKSMYNGVIVTGENSADNTPPVVGSAYLTDPADPMRWGGPFGRRARTVNSSLVTSSTQAVAMAQDLLRRLTAPHVVASISTVPNAALDAGDVIRIVHTSGRSELAVVQSFTVPLTADGGDCALTLWDTREEP
jgi:hypothetical protein